MMSTLKGSCLCGAVRYELDKPNIPDGSCSCQACREANVIALIGNIGVPQSRFRWTAGESGLSAYEIALGVCRRFCGSCSSPLVEELVASRRVAVRTASLDRANDQTAEKCIFDRMT